MAYDDVFDNALNKKRRSGATYPGVMVSADNPFETQVPASPTFDAGVTPLPKNPSPAQTLPMTAQVPAAPVAPKTYANMPGWEETKLNDASHVTPKYVFGRYVQQYDVKTPEGRTQLLAALKADPSGFFKNATLNNDILDVGAGADPSFGGDRQFDVFSDFGGKTQPWWYSLEQSARDRAAAPTSPAAGTGGETLSQMLARMFGYNGSTSAASLPSSYAAPPPAIAPAPVANAPVTPTVATAGGGYAADQSEANFDSQAYLAANPDVASGWGASPYQHYVQYGAHEGRAFTPNASGASAAPAPSRAVDGSTNWQAGAPVPSMPGYVYNPYGGFEQASLGGASSTVPSSTGNITPGQYDDPATNDLLNFIMQRIPGLIQQGTTTPQSIQDLIGAIQGAAVNTANSPETAQLQELLKQAIGRANAPAYDDNQKSILRADALSQLQQAHDQAQVQARQELAARNIPPDSGVALQMQQRIADQYARNKALVERGLSIDEINKLDSNRQMALQAAGESTNVATTQQSKVLELMKLATDLESGDVNRQNAALDKALSLFSIPVQIGDQRFEQANAAANGVSANPSSLLTTLANIAQGNNAIDVQRQQNSASMWSNLAKAIASIDWTGKKGGG